MTYRKSGSAALQRAYRAARDSRYPIDQVINAKDALHLFPAASEAPAQAVRDAWSALMPGQAVPLVYEPVEVENDDGTFGAGI